MIRPARPDDAEAICAIFNPVIRDTTVTFTTLEKTPQGMAELIAKKADDGHVALVAEIDGSLAGFAHTFQFRNGPGYRFAAEHSIVLAPAAQGRGIGLTLMQALMREAAEKGLHTLWAGVSGENPRAVAFHVALGFEVTATLREVGWKFDRWIDLTLMRKAL